MPAPTREGPSFIYYSSKSCEPCKQFQKQLDDYELETGRYDHMIVDIDSNDGFEWCQNYAVRSVPTLVLLGLDGGMVRRMNCAQVKTDGIKALVEMVEDKWVDSSEV